MSQKQQELAHIILRDPSVESLSSFIGVDGTNTVMNSGRIQVNLKPLSVRKQGVMEIIRRLQEQVAGVEGMRLYLQPVQDLTVESRVSRTQYQYTLSDPDSNELNQWTERFVARLKEFPEIRDVATDLQSRGAATALVIDRLTASRLGISAQLIDETLYDAFGQRQVVTLFTQLNQYHLILEALPEFQKEPGNLNNIYIRSNFVPPVSTSSTTGTIVSATTPFSGGAVPLSTFRAF